VPHPTPPILTDKQLEMVGKELAEVNPQINIPLTNPNITGPKPTTGANITYNNVRMQDPSVMKINMKIPSDSALQGHLNFVNLGDPIKVFHSSLVRNQSVAPVPEPSAANDGQKGRVLYTYNWGVAFSVDGGKSWNFDTPFNGMSDFCCDQDVVFDSSQQIFIWYRQALKDTAGNNYIKISISSDLINWQSYNINASQVGYTGKNFWLDFPHLSLSDNYLYFTTNLFSSSSLSDSILFRIKLSDLSARPSTLNYQFLNSVRDTGLDKKFAATVTPVQGATSAMYAGAQIGNDKFRIFRWMDNNNLLKWYDVGIPAWWTSNRGTHHCSPSDVNTSFRNPCAWSDNRVTGGWILGKSIGFLWDVGECIFNCPGTTFLHPYINVVTFELNKEFVGDVFRFRDNTFIHGGGPADTNDNFNAEIAPNRLTGSLAISYFSTSFITGNPKVNVQILDGNYDPFRPDWTHPEVLFQSDDNPIADRVGDYLRVKPFGPPASGCPVWATTAYKLIGPGTPPIILPDGSLRYSPTNDIELYYIIFGRSLPGNSCSP
jgi:hypothetical protein